MKTKASDHNYTTEVAHAFADGIRIALHSIVCNSELGVPEDRAIVNLVMKAGGGSRDDAAEVGGALIQAGLQAIASSIDSVAEAMREQAAAIERVAGALE